MSLIEVKGLCKSFGTLEVLKDLNLSVEEGEVIAITAGEGSVTGVLEHDGRRLWLRPDFCTKMTLAVNDDDPALAGHKAACVPVVRGRDYDEHLFSIELCFGDAESAAACCAAVHVDDLFTSCREFRSGSCLCLCYRRRRSVHVLVVILLILVVCLTESCQ